MLTHCDEGVFYDSIIIDGLRIAHPIQLFLDLKQLKGKGEKAASKQVH